MTRIKTGQIITAISTIYMLLIAAWANYLEINSKYKLVIGCIFIISITLTIILGKDDKTCIFSVPNKLGILLFFVIGLGFLITGIALGNITYLVFCIVFVFIFPALYAVIQTKKELQVVLESLAKGVTYAFAAVIFSSFVFAPVTAAQYSSVLGNPNALGDYAVAALASSIYMLFMLNNSRKKKYFYYFIIIMSLVLSFLSRSRTTVLSVIPIILMWIIAEIYFHKSEQDKVKNLAKKILVLAILTVFFAYASIYIGSSITPKIVELLGLSDSLNYFNMENNNDLDMQEATELFMDRADQGISKGGRFTSGRVDIWKYYIERIGFLGHQNETIYPTSNGGFLNAHNAYIQLSYSAGIVSGIGLIILSVFLVVRAIKMIINEVKEKRWTPELLFAVMISAGFALRVMVSALYTPFNYALTVAFWVVISTFMVKNHYSMRKRYER